MLIKESKMCDVVPLKLLAAQAIPLKEIAKDRKEIMKLLGYPDEIVADILFKEFNNTICTKREHVYAIDEVFSFYTIRRITVYLRHGQGQNVLKREFPGYTIYQCSRCGVKAKSSDKNRILPCFRINYDNFGKLQHLCYRCFLQKNRNNVAKNVNTMTAAKKYEKILNIIKQDFLTKKFMRIKIKNGQEKELFIINDDYTKLLEKNVFGSFIS